MACHLAGVTTAIATCGTAFGSDHISVLRRVMGDDSAAGEVVFTFDPDAAGQKAALRAFADAKRFNAQTYVATGPDGLDPCDLRLQRGDGAVRALMDTKVPMVEFVIDQRISGYDLSSVEGRVGALRAAAPVVAELRDPLLQPEYVRVLARRLGMDTEDVRREVERAGARDPQRTAGAAGRGIRRPRSPMRSRRVTIASLPRHRRCALSSATRSWASCSSAIGSTAELLDPCAGTALRHPALDAVRSRHRRSARSTRAGWAADAVARCASPTARWRRASRRRLPRADRRSRASPQPPILLAASSLRALDREKSELLGAIQRVPPDSEEGRVIRLRLREFDCAAPAPDRRGSSSARHA